MHDPLCRQQYLPTLPCTCGLLARARADLAGRPAHAQPDPYGLDDLPITDEAGLAWLGRLRERGIVPCKNLLHLMEAGSGYCPPCKAASKSRRNHRNYLNRKARAS